MVPTGPGPLPGGRSEYTVSGSHAGILAEKRDGSGFPERWIPAFRKVVIVTILINVALFAIVIPVEYQARLDDIVTTDALEKFNGSLVSPEFFAAYNTGLVAVCGVLFCLLALLILMRQPDTFMPLFVSLVLVLEGTQISGLFYSLEELHSSGRWFAEVSDVISTTLLVTFFLIFPTGHFVPAWTKWFVVAVLLVGVVSVAVAIADPQAEPLEDYVMPTLVFLATVFAVMIYAQVHRFRWVLTASERQQVKWVLVGMIAALACFSAAVVATVVSSDRSPLEIMFWFTVANLGFVMIPLAITIAILRYKLFDIDTLINRTIVYTIVTALLAAMYVTSVFLLQSVLGEFAGSSGTAVALSTLLAAALFRPLRDRTQHVVDRRFYRTRYDAAELLSRFSHSIRDEVDLDRVQIALTYAISEAVRPSQITIWLYDSKNDGESGMRIGTGD